MTISKREFLKLMSTTGGSLLINHLLSNPVAWASSSAPKGSRKYVVLDLYGAPPRTMFDLFLRPMPQDAARMVYSPMLATAYAGSGTYTNGYYRGYAHNSSNHGVVTLPHMWSLNIPTSNGSSVPMNKLLDHWLCLRGVDLEIDGHQQNQARVAQPIGQKSSLGAIVAENNVKPFPGVRLSPGNYYLPFVSKTGDSAKSVYTPADGKNHITDHFKSIAKVKDTKSHRLKEGAYNSYEAALARINEVILRDQEKSDIVRRDRSMASIVIRQGLKDADTFWAPTVQKYTSLIQRAISVTSDVYPAGVPGLTDQPIGIAAASRNATYRIDLNGYAPNHIVVANPDVRTILNYQDGIPGMAESFAVMEFFLRNGFTNYLSLTLNHHFRKLWVQRQDNYQYINNGVTYHDQHSTGFMVGLLINAMYYRGLASCLYELISVLKGLPGASGSLFDETVFQIGAEFNRSMRNDGTGGDHGFYGQSFSFTGGNIEGLNIVGNIRRISRMSNAAYHSTWGDAGKITMPNGSSFTPKIDHYADTVATLLGLNKVSVNAFSLVTESGQSLMPPPEITNE